MNFKLLFILSLFAVSSKAQTYAASNFTLVGQLDPETNFNQYGDKYSGCWGWYQASKNKEYAIACSSGGTFWVDITSPATPTVSSFRAGKQGCTWREVKTYLNYCYVVSDDPGTNSFQIFDMQYLPDSVHKVYDSQALFQRAHTLWVDGTKLYVAATTSANAFSSMSVYDLTNPASPTLLRKLSQDYPLINYVHDMFVRNDTIYASCAFQGLYIYRLTSANTFTQLGSLTSYPSSGYNHSSALTPDGQTLVFTDEIPVSLPIKVADVSNLSNIQVVATTNQFTQTTPHNPFIVNNQYCFVSSYQDGLQLFDISTPSAPFLAGYFDTYPAAGGNNNSWPSNNDYEGQWGAYPYFPSKTIFALDESNGLFLLKTALYENEPVTAGFATGTETLCVGASADFFNTSSGATSYTWSYTGGTSVSTSTNNLSLAFNTAGTFSITLLAASATNSSSSTHTILITPNNLNGLTSFTNADCSTCPNGAVAVSVSGGTAPYTYTWLPPGSHISSVQGLTPACYTVQIKDVAGCLSETTTCVSFFTALRSLFGDKNVTVYPNPAQNLLNIESIGTFDFCMYNKLGQVVLSGKNNFQKTTLSLADLPKGVYFVEVNSGSSKINQKIIIN